MYLWYGLVENVIYFKEMLCIDATGKLFGQFTLSCPKTCVVFNVQMNVQC